MPTKFTPPPTTGSARKIIPAGNHMARCVRFIDIGTQTSEWEGVEKEQRRFRLSFETPDETEIFNEDKGPEPFMVSIEMTLSFHEKSNMNKMFPAWLGKPLNPATFDPQKDLIGRPGMVSITHGEWKGKTFAKITAVTGLPKGLECPEQVNESKYFFLGNEGLEADFDDKMFATFPDFIQDKIKNSAEYQKLFGNDPVKEQMIADAKEVFAEKKS